MLSNRSRHDKAEEKMLCDTRRHWKITMKLCLLSDRRVSADDTHMDRPIQFAIGGDGMWKNVTSATGVLPAEKDETRQLFPIAHQKRINSLWCDVLLRGTSTSLCTTRWRVLNHSVYCTFSIQICSRVTLQAHAANFVRDNDMQGARVVW